MLRTALVVGVSEPAPIVDGWRERTCSDKPSIGVPAHVTLLFPFVPAERLDDRLLAELDALFARFDPFALVFASRGRSGIARSGDAGRRSSSRSRWAMIPG